jgi:lysophospholipase L1-like esterase
MIDTGESSVRHRLTMLRRTFLYLALGCSFSCLQAEQPKPWPPARPGKHDYGKWERAVSAFEKADKKSPPPKGAVLFVGSSTIVRWKTLKEDFPGLTVLNRGFGGNQIKDSTHYAERMIFPYEPSVIVLRAGGNDINLGWPAKDVFEDFKTFVTKMRGRFTDIPIVYIGLSPTVKREAQIAEGNQLNDLIAAYAKNEKGISFIETRTSTIGADGRPRADLFVSDMLHFNEEGYKILADLVRPVVTRVAKRAAKP